MSESNIPTTFSSQYYDSEYFTGSQGGKKFRTANGKIKRWSYYNKLGEWGGCEPIVKAWKTMFNPRNMLDVGSGRGTFIAYCRDVGIEAEGFDFSEFAIKHPYPRCKKEWLKLHDATKPWPYKDNSFDLVVALDFFEHMYMEDLEFVISEMYRVAEKWVFLQIAVAGTGGLQGRIDNGYILKKGDPIPLGLEGCAVAGHVTVQPESFWYEKFERDDWLPRRDAVNWFASLVDKAIIQNWLLNSIIVLERLE